MLLFDIGANRGDATAAALFKGYSKIIALEPAPRVFAELVRDYAYSPNVVPLKFAVASKDGETIEFYECVEDGLSTLNVDWLTDASMPYNGKEYRTIHATTCTVDWLAEQYGEPDLIKIDVEGAEWEVLKGMSRYHGKLALEWTDVTLEEHLAQLEYLRSLGYTKFAPQFITHHIEEPEVWYPLDGDLNLDQWVEQNSQEWEETGWKSAGLRPTADVGMVWVR